MSGHRDTRPASWARRLPSIRRKAQELRELDFTVIEPENLDTPPHLRNGSPAEEHRL